MTKIELLVLAAIAVTVCASEAEDVEQKKRGTGKTTSLNAIPSGAQKPDYTYSIYSQNPSPQANQAYAQLSNSFYPSQNSQYYAPQNVQSEQHAYSPQSQINLIPPTTSPQFVPLNFIPNPGYQAKYQIVPSKSSNGNIQLAILQPPPNYQSPLLQYPQTILPPNHHQFAPQQNPLLIPQGHYNVGPNYQPVPFGGSYIGQPSSMLLIPQSNPQAYNNLFYQNPVQSLYNYYPAGSQAKFGPYVTPSPQTPEYEKIPNSQSISKEDNDIAPHNTEYVSSSDSSYKNAYAASRRTSYTKLK